MSESNNTSMRSDIEEKCRVQLEEEVLRRKGAEEKYLATYDELLEYKEKLKKAYKTQGELVRYNRDLLSCNMSFVEFLKQKRSFKNNEQKMLDKGIDYWRPVFDPKYYAEQNRDIAAAFGTQEDALFNHFIRFGSFEGRQASKDFDVERYLEYNPDVAESCVMDKRAAYMHYIEYGMKEKRRK